ncbi:MAG: FHA domain-containing protein [Prevotella sp.]|nr:FHA domain-containing protein [Prevotella sp.]
MRLIKIGRDATCDIVLHSDKVSSLHAELTLTNSGDILLEDKNSRNGTFIQNKQIAPGSPVSVRRGDAIRFADVELQWNQVPMPEDNSAYKAIYGIGSHFNNDIQISGSTVSRYHATIKVGRDGKVYIVDHSKNGTTVDGKKITPKTPCRIKPGSAVACGGVPVNLKNTVIQWPAQWGKTLLMTAATLLVLVGIGWGAYTLFTSGSGKTWTQKDISERYTSTTMMLIGQYHYEVDCNDDLKKFMNSWNIPTKFYWVVNKKTKEGGLLPLTENDKVSDQGDIIQNSYSATGFFISKDGKILTNLHVAKPWLFGDELQTVETFVRKKLAAVAELHTANKIVTGLSGYLTEIKVKGVSDGIMLIPQGAYYSVENAIMCHVVSAGDDPQIDVAMIQCDKQELPNARCSYVNVQDSIDVSDEACSVGTPIYTIGFPHGISLQDIKSEQGLQAFSHGGHITMVNSDYNFNFDATSYHGASGSPVFNDKGMLIGILNSGVEKENFNQAIKAKYIKELLDGPIKK